MIITGRRWLLGLLGKKTFARLSDRGLSTVRTNARALIRIANEADGSDLHAAGHDAPATAGGEIRRRTLTAAENRLASSISEAISPDVSVQVIERDVITPILRSAVVVSGLAYEAVDRAISSAAHRSGT